MSTRLILVRHGRTEWNASGRFQGHADVPLDATGLAQARALAPHVAALGPTSVVSSDLVRARVTAEVIAEASGLEARVDPRVREINVGSWAGQGSDYAARDFPGFWDALREGRDFRRSASGETATEAGERVAGALRDLADAGVGGVTLVVGHGLALRMAMLNLLGWEISTAPSLSGLWNCSWTVLELAERWKLLSYNNVVPGFTGRLESLSSP